MAVVTAANAATMAVLTALALTGPLRGAVTEVVAEEEVASTETLTGAAARVAGPAEEGVVEAATEMVEEAIEGPGLAPALHDKARITDERGGTVTAKVRMTST